MEIKRTQARYILRPRSAVDVSRFLESDRRRRRRFGFLGIERTARVTLRSGDSLRLLSVEQWDANRMKISVSLTPHHRWPYQISVDIMLEYGDSYIAVAKLRDTWMEEVRTFRRWYAMIFTVFFFVVFVQAFHRPVFFFVAAPLAVLELWRRSTFVVKRLDDVVEAVCGWVGDFDVVPTDD